MRYNELSDTIPCGHVIFISTMAIHFMANRTGGEQI